MDQISTQDFLNDFIASLGYEPTGGQQKAAEMISEFMARPVGDNKRCFLLKGYAGTGKTSLVSALVRILPKHAIQSVLLAPTGRAAKVFSGYAGKQASTIHRKIYQYTQDENGFQQMSLAPNAHKNTLFLIDEASMIAGDEQPTDPGKSFHDLLDDLISYVYSNTGNRMILLGDEAQLPPVGVELSPALDPEVLVKKYYLDLEKTELHEVVRQTLDSGILYNATVLRMKLLGNHTGLPLFNLQNYNDIKSISGGEFEEYLNSCYSRFGYDNTVVITRSNKRANLFNNEIRTRILFRETHLSAGDMIMVTKNNYFWLPRSSKPGFIANGDLMEVRRIMKKGEMYGFHFADVSLKMVDYPEEDVVEVKLWLENLQVNGPSMSRDDVKALYDEIYVDYSEEENLKTRQQLVRKSPWMNALQAKFAYAITCHKTQGGQWDAVFIDKGFLTGDMIDTGYLRWLYTAVTRAATELYLVNFEDEFFEPYR